MLMHKALHQLISGLSLLFLGLNRIIPVGGGFRPICCCSPRAESTGNKLRFQEQQLHKQSGLTCLAAMKQTTHATRVCNLERRGAQTREQNKDRNETTTNRCTAPKTTETSCWPLMKLSDSTSKGQGPLKFRHLGVAVAGGKTPPKRQGFGGYPVVLFAHFFS